MKKYLICVFLCCLALLLSACTEELTPTEPTQTQPPPPQFVQERVILNETHDNIGAGFYLSQEMDVTERNGLVYAFSQSISQEDRTACIQATETLLARMGLGQPLQITVFDPTSYDENYIDSGMLYTYRQDWHSSEYLTGLILSVCGEYCNYGAAYGYANFLGQEIFGSSLLLCGEGWTFSGDQNVLDLNCLCFRYPHCAVQDTKAAKRLANTFVNAYIAEHDEKAFQTLLRQSGNTEDVDTFLATLSDFYASIGIDYAPSAVLYRPGGCGYSYIAKGSYATIYMERDWVDYNSNRVPTYYDGYLRDDYGQIKTYLTTVFREMEQYQALFPLEEYDNTLDVYFSNYHRGGSKAVYDADAHIIALPYCNSLSILYIRSLIYDYFPDGNWAYYGLQTHFSFYFDQWGNAEDNYVYNLNYDYTYLRPFQEYRKRIGRDIVIGQDFADLSHFYAYYQGHTDPNYGSSDSFVAYLISRFGQDETISMLLNQDLGEYTYEELVADWNAFLQASFGNQESQDVTS